MEHFRPKGAVSAWPEARDVARRGSLGEFDGTASGQASGYWWLAYVPWNYVTSCSVCNTDLKGERFPLAGKAGRKPNQKTLKAIAEDVGGAAARDEILRLNEAEQPLLLYPLGDLDDDPESVITWLGPLPRAAFGPEDQRHQRARVTIAFFHLDGEGGRRDLITARAVGLSRLFVKLERALTGDADAKRSVELQTADTRPFAACMRAFRALHQEDRAKAAEMARMVERIADQDPDLKPR